jgi:lipopolysaccharide transport system permease protein
MSTDKYAAEPIASPKRIIIRPRKHLQFVDLGELKEYRDLFRFLIWREIKVRYAQSALGISWAMLQPLVSALVLMLAFGYFANLSTDGSPKFLFYFCALVPWTFFSSAITDGTASMINNAPMIGKVYFPRIVLPLSAVVARLIDFVVAFVVLLVLLVVERMVPRATALTIPLLLLIALVASSGIGLWLSALSVQFRDVKYAITFVVQLLMYASPVIYSTSGIPETLTIGIFNVPARHLYSLNPMAGVIEGFRSSLLGTMPMPWTMISIGSISAVSLAVTGVIFFRAREQVFADVV